MALLLPLACGPGASLPPSEGADAHDASIPWSGPGSSADTEAGAQDGEAATPDSVILRDSNARSPREDAGTGTEQDAHARDTWAADTGDARNGSAEEDAPDAWIHPSDAAADQTLLPDGKDASHDALDGFVDVEPPARDGGGGGIGQCGAVGQVCCPDLMCSTPLVCQYQTCAAVTPGWTRLPAVGLPRARLRTLAVSDTGAIYVAAFGVGVYRSTDRGLTFDKLGVPTTENDPPSHAIMTVGVNARGEPVVGYAQGSSGTTYSVVARFNAQANRWVSSTVSAPVNSGYFPPGIRRDSAGTLYSSWPFRPDVMRSTDDGSTWSHALPIPNAAHKPPNGPSPAVKAVYGVAVQPVSGEMFVGTEGDQWWHSTDQGATWSMVDEQGTTSIGTEPGQNGFLIAFNRDGEPLIGTQGKPYGRFLMRLRSDGSIVASDSGFGPWAMVGTSNEFTVLREMPLTSDGYQFMAMPVNNSAGGAFPCDLYGSSDGATSWQKLQAPFVPELNALATFASSVLVGGSAQNPGELWMYTPPITNRIPVVRTGVSPGSALRARRTGLTLSGSATDPDGDPLTYVWKGRGPSAITFGAPASPQTTVSFASEGDYVLTLHASDGVASAGAPVIVQVRDTVP